MTSISSTTPATEPAKPRNEAQTAVWVGVVCYIIWGLFPLLFIEVAKQGVDPWEATAERCVWAMVFAGALVAGTGHKSDIMAALRQPKLVGWLVVSALSISLNWVVFIWASINGQIASASLAYFIGPLLAMVVGAALFRERITTLGWVAVGLATAGVAVQTMALGKLPLVSLVLALTFLAYGIIRKRAAVPALTGMFVECLLLTPPALVYIAWLQMHGGNHFGHGVGPTVMIFLLGPATVIPFSMFAWAARRMPFSALGFIQFIAPTLLFVLAIGSGEALSKTSLVSFVLIWCGVALFSYQAWQKARAKARLA